MLSRHFELLPTKKCERHLEMVFHSTRNLAQLIEEVLLLGRVELEKFYHSFADELHSASGGACP